MTSAIERREQLVEILRLRHSDRVCNLAVELGVSEKTIYRDVLALSLSYPIEAISGMRGGVVWTGKQATAPVVTDREIEALNNALAFASPEDKAVIARLIKTLRPEEPFSAEWLFKILEASGLTQRRLADRLGITEFAFSNYLSGKRKPTAIVERKIREMYREVKHEG
ncbi:hypothetical protein FACS1894211_06510 [Clostridia bacterium]|nr:hypothetical protein FACS1894211_06510 [Clostridia bacterium]